MYCERATERIGELGRSLKEIVVVSLCRGPIANESEVVLSVWCAHEMDVLECRADEQVQEGLVHIAERDVEMYSLLCRQSRVPGLVYDLTDQLDRKPGKLFVALVPLHDLVRNVCHFEQTMIQCVRAR